MREGKWVIFKDVDRGSNEVLALIKPLIESLGLGNWIGGRASLDIAGRGKVVAADTFAIFATRSVLPSRNGAFPAATFYGAHKLHEVVVHSPSGDELQSIVKSHYPRLTERLDTVVGSGQGAWKYSFHERHWVEGVGEVLFKDGEFSVIPSSRGRLF